MSLSIRNSIEVQGFGDDKLNWKLSTQKGFEVCSYYRVLAH